MDLFAKKSFKEALTVAGLGAWAAVTLTLMMVRSWTAGNAYWVSIFVGLICFSAALAVYAWRLAVLDEDEEEGEADG